MVARNAGFKRRWAAALGGVAALLLLLMPVSLPPGGPVWRAVGGTVHVGLFAGLAWLVGRALPSSRRGWVLWAGLATVAAGTEGLQPFVGRSAEWADWLYGVAGAACICGTWRWRRSLRWIAVSLLCLFPSIWEGAMAGMEFRAFPVLAKPGALWSSRGWNLNGVDLAFARGEGFRLSPDPHESRVAYPGFFRNPVCRDWCGIRSLRLDLYWPSARTAVFAVRIDDRFGNPPYADRFQREFSVGLGWNSVVISAAEIAQTAGGRPLRLDQIRQWGVFLVSDIPFDYFLVGPVGLEMQEEQP